MFILCVYVNICLYVHGIHIVIFINIDCTVCIQSSEVYKYSVIATQDLCKFHINFYVFFIKNIYRFATALWENQMNLEIKSDMPAYQFKVLITTNLETFFILGWIQNIILYYWIYPISYKIYCYTKTGHLTNSKTASKSQNKAT